MINPINWHKFNSDEEKDLQLIKWKLMSKKRKTKSGKDPKPTKQKQFFYNGAYTDEICPCEIVGYSEEANESDIAVIEIKNQLHKIHIDCLKDMQPTKKEAETING